MEPKAITMIFGQNHPVEVHVEKWMPSNMVAIAVGDKLIVIRNTELLVLNRDEITELYEVARKYVDKSP